LVGKHPSNQCKLYHTLAAKFLPYGVNMKWWKLRSEDQCPRYHHPAKTKTDITQCQAPKAVTQTQWQASLQSVDKWLQANNTQNSPRNDLLDGLRMWQCREQGSSDVAFRTRARHKGWKLSWKGVYSRRNRPVIGRHKKSN